MRVSHCSHCAPVNKRCDFRVVKAELLLSLVLPQSCVGKEAPELEELYSIPDQV